jgi:lipoyl(octanoyl) transferase
MPIAGFDDKQSIISVASVSLLRASMRFTLRASLRLFKIIPDDFVWQTGYRIRAARLMKGIQAKVRHLGLRPYETVWRDMQVFTDSRMANSADEIWLLQHEPVFTLGKNGKLEHVIDPGAIPVVNSDRGGQVTYHGPGQIVAYMLIDIARLNIGVRELVTRLENAVIALLAEYGIEALAQKDAPGVYVEGKKIAALGLRVRRGRSFHGLAFNVDMDLEPFSRINPCGYEGLEVTQLSALADNIDYDTVEQQLLRQLQHGLYT